MAVVGFVYGGGLLVHDGVVGVVDGGEGRGEEVLSAL